MKLETTVITTKAVCSFIVGATLTLASGLAQWATSGETPGKIAWIIILSTSIGTGFSKLGDFLSGSFSTYMASRNTNGDTGEVKFTKPLEPTTPVSAGATDPKTEQTTPVDPAKQTTNES